MKKNFLFHVRPRTIPVQALRFSLTWGLGGAAALLITMQLVSGLLLSFFYEPVPAQAYLSVLLIQDNILLGQLLRNLHHWTGHALVIVVFLHLLRIIINRAYAPPRHWNWLVGLGLGLLVLLANFSGYLLPWDQLSYWAVTIATSILSYIPLVGTSLQQAVRGGDTVGASTLQIFHTVHTGLVPILLFLLMAYHFWLVRRAGGVLLPSNDGKSMTDIKENNKNVPVIPELLTREIAFTAVVICALLLFSMLINAPLGSMANPDLTPSTVRAPWYFVGVQELLLHVPAMFAVLILPLAGMLLLVVLPFAGNINVKYGRILKILLYCFLVVFLGLTITGIWFRGPGMQLVLPW